MADSNNTASGGIGFTGLLTIVFITLKLTHQVNWSWWWVLSPIWISTLITVSIILLVVVLALALPDRSRKARRRG